MKRGKLLFFGLSWAAGALFFWCAAQDAHDIFWPCRYRWEDVSFWVGVAGGSLSGLVSAAWADEVFAFFRTCRAQCTLARQELRSRATSPEAMRGAFLVLVAAMVVIAATLVAIACAMVC